MGDDDFGGVVRGWDVGNTVCKGWFRVVHTRLAKREDGVMDWITRHCGSR